MIEIERYFLWYVFYSLIGWLYESVMYTVKQRRFVNRGFLNGPYCPIYGAGAILNILLLHDIQHPVLLFLAGAVLACSLECLTSWSMEQLFHARWWDYRKYPFNLNGRICLYGALVFGVFAVALILFIHPAVVIWTKSIPAPALHIISGSLLILMIIDTVTTVGGVRHLNRLLLEAARSFGNESWFVHRLGLQQKRMLKSFPTLISTQYSQALDRVRQSYFRLRRKGDTS